MRDPFAPRPRRRIPFWLAAAIVLGCAGLLVYLLDSAFPGAVDEDGGMPRLAYSVILLVVLGAALVSGRRIGAGKMLRYAAGWVFIFALVVLGYSFRTDVRGLGDRIVGELRPDLALTTTDGEIAVRRSGDNHFRLTATVNGTPVRFLIDTGATTVVLTAADARRIGLDPDALSFSFRSATANGAVATARVSLANIEAGPIHVRDIDASVIRRGLSESLLGLSFLDRLSGYEVRQDRMILRP